MADDPTPDGPCYFCKKTVGDEYFCFGCKEYICDECSTNDDSPWGGHIPEDHQEED